MIMESLKVLFSDFSELFDETTSPERKKEIETSINKKVQENMDLLESLAKSQGNFSSITINH